MRILFLAPQPFFQDRGTPIAVRLALEVLGERLRSTAGEDCIDLLTYHEGTDLPIPGVQHHRIWAPRFLRGITAGFSLKKLCADLFFFFAVFKLIIKNRHNQYDLIHAVEESVFMALVFRWALGIPYIYDMDSSMALQLTESMPVLKSFQGLFDRFERTAVRHSLAVVPVCDALFVIARRYGAPDTQIVRDISLLELEGESSPSKKWNLQKEASLPSESVVALYVGNLETYQGIDLLLESFEEAGGTEQCLHIVIIGGAKPHLESYTQKVKESGLSGRIHFLGPRPVEALGTYLLQADILLSPRTKGNNTPMKIYSYLHSGVPILATDLPTHTQVLTEEVALLARPEPKSFGAGLLRLAQSAELRRSLGEKAYALAEELYTYPVFSRDLNALYDRVSKRIGVAVLNGQDEAKAA